MAKLTDNELRTLAANARANDGQVEKWLDRDRSLALIEEVIDLRAALSKALRIAEFANETAGGYSHDRAQQIAELRRLVEP